MHIKYESMQVHSSVMASLRSKVKVSHCIKLPTTKIQKLIIRTDLIRTSLVDCHPHMASVCHGGQPLACFLGQVLFCTTHHLSGL